MEIAKDEIQAIKEATAQQEYVEAVLNLADFELALVGGGSTDVTFC